MTRKMKWKGRHGGARKVDRTLVLLVGALLALPVVTAAQQGEGPHRHGDDQPPAPGDAAGTMMMMRTHMMDMHGHGPMMSSVAGPGPTMILRQREVLDLTEEQVQRLETLQERMARVRAEHTAAMRPIHDTLREQMSDPAVDLDEYEATLRSLAEQHVTMRVEMSRAGREAHEVLTPEQRETLRTGMAFMRGMVMEGMQGRMSRMRTGGMSSMMGTAGTMPCGAVGDNAGGGS